MERITVLQPTIGSISLNRLTYTAIEKLPIKLQIFFILRFASISTQADVSKLIKMIKTYENEKDTQIDETTTLKLIESYTYEITGILFNSYVSSSIIKNDYFLIFK